jgi:hypothetical protein
MRLKIIAAMLPVALAALLLPATAAGASPLVSSQRYGPVRICGYLPSAGRGQDARMAHVCLGTLSEVVQPGSIVYALPEERPPAHSSERWYIQDLGPLGSFGRGPGTSAQWAAQYASWDVVVLRPGGSKTLCAGPYSNDKVVIRKCPATLDEATQYEPMYDWAWDLSGGDISEMYALTGYVQKGSAPREAKPEKGHVPWVMTAEQEPGLNAYIAPLRGGNLSPLVQYWGRAGQ